MSEWRAVVGWEGCFEVSDEGEVFNVRTRRLRKATPDEDGYLCLGLDAVPHKRADAKVHILVCEAFHGPRPPLMQVRHLDGNCQNNRADNLAWGTADQNADDMLRHGTHRNARKTHCKRNHPLEGENVLVDKNGARQCRTCRRLREKRIRDRRKRLALIAKGER